MKFHVFNDTIKALLLAAAKDDVRYYLNGVCIDVRAGDACAVATNGHILLAVPLALADDAGELVPGQYIIPREALEGIKPTHKSLPVTIEVLTPAPTPDPERPGVTLRKSPTATVFAGGAVAHVQLVDGRYPEWRRVVPLEVSYEPGQYKADYVAAFGKMHKLLGGKESPAIAYNGEHGAARVLLPGDAVGVLMPMRYDARPTVDNPSFLDRPGVTPTAAAA
jgi:DNA polymerase-3 subunit beta